VSSRLATVRRLEREFHPPHMRQMQDITSWSELAEYCECRPQHVRLHLVGSQGYVLWARTGRRSVEVVDIAGRFDHRLMSALRRVAKPGWAIRADVREDTAYRIVQALARRGHVRIVQDTPWDWDGVNMHEMVLVVSR